MSKPKEVALEREILAFIRQEALLTDTSRPLVAVSGGRDSMFLLHLLMRHWSVAVAHFNFQLRGEESFRDEAFVTNFCQEHAIPLHVRREDTHQWCAANGVSSTQVGCRQLRYTFFEELVAQYGYTEIVTAHHADDQAETLLFRLARGTGLRGMMGMRPRNGLIVRPLLRTTRAAIDRWVAEERMPYQEDSSNETDKYTRNYIRHQILPHLSHFNAQALQHLVEATEAVAEGNRALTAEAEALWGSLDAEGPFFWEYETQQTAAHPDLARYWLRERLGRYGFSQDAIRTALALFHSSSQTGRYVESAAWRATYDRGRLCVLARPVAEAAEDFPLRIDETTTEVFFSRPLTYMGQEWKRLTIRDERLPYFASEEAFKAYVRRGRETALFAPSLLHYPLSLRRWRAGDFFMPLGMGGHRKKVSDLLTDLRLPSYARQEVLVLEDAAGVILWVVGLAVSCGANGVSLAGACGEVGRLSVFEMS